MSTLHRREGQEQGRSCKAVSHEASHKSETQLPKQAAESTMGDQGQGMLERAARCHPSLARAGVPNQGIYTPKEKFHKQDAQCAYISVGDVRLQQLCASDDDALRSPLPCVLHHS